jgi:hypothetical protein
MRTKFQTILKVVWDLPGNAGSNPAPPAKCRVVAFGGGSFSGLGHWVNIVIVIAKFGGETTDGEHGSYARLSPVHLFIGDSC